MTNPCNVPTVSFDIKLGERFEHLDLNAALAAEYLTTGGFSEEAVQFVNIHLSAGSPLGEGRDRLRYGEARRRKATLFLGSYLLAAEEYDKDDTDLLVTVLGSKTIAHELTHVKQFEDNAIPPAGHAEYRLTWAERPWEVEANSAEAEYFSDLERGNVGLLLSAQTKF